jgi:hypothetical protein
LPFDGLFLWALLIALAVNADSVQIADRLWTDEAVRSAVVARAEQAETAGDVDIDQTVRELEIPLGWNLSLAMTPGTLRTRPPRGFRKQSASSSRHSRSFSEPRFGLTFSAKLPIFGRQGVKPPRSSTM